MIKLENINLLPYDYELEKLGISLLVYDISYLDQMDELCFYTKDARYMFEAIKKTKSTDFKVVSIESWVSEEVVLEISSAMISSSSIDYIVEQLHRYKYSRIILKWVTKLDALARWLEIDGARETILKLGSLIQEAATEKTTEQYALDYFDDIDKEKKVISTWYAMLDKYIEFNWWQLIVVAGRPWQWKTSAMLNLAFRQSIYRNVWYISMEMWVFELFDRLVCIAWWVTSQEVKDKKGNIEKVSNYLSQILENKLFMSEQIYTLPKIENFIIKNKVDVCYIDYLGLIQYWDSKMKTNDKISDITRTLKFLARKYNCAIVVWSQLNREVEKWYDKKPALSHLRDSGSIEQDADIVIMLHREECYDRDTENKNKIDILIRKNRNWPTKEVMLDCDFECYRIMDSGFIRGWD